MSCPLDRPCKKCGKKFHPDKRWWFWYHDTCAMCRWKES